MPPNMIVSKCNVINLMYLSDLVATSEEKWKNIFFLYKSIDLVPKIEITNISASICLIHVSLGLLNSSQLALLKSGEKMVISITHLLFLLSMSYKGQLKVKEKSCLKSFYVYLFYLHLVIGLVGLVSVRTFEIR